MTCLLLDTATKYVTLSIIKEDKICYYFHDKIFEDLSIKILPLLKTALDECNLNIRNIEKIYVATGPGSFTGIRIGLTIMKIIAWSLNIDIVPISSLELLASSDVDVDYIIPYIDARRGNCYIAIYDNNLNVIEKDQFTCFEEFIKKNVSDKQFKIVTYEPLENDNKILPKINISKVVNKHKNDIPVNPHSLNPNYLKLTEAEEKLKNKND